MKQLEHMNLPVPMSSSVPWTLNRTHVKVAFRMCVSVIDHGCCLHICFTRPAQINDQLLKFLAMNEMLIIIVSVKFLSPRKH